jgi:Rrf2 family protein
LISRRTEYALKAMIAMSKRPKEALSVDSIALSEQMPVAFLRAIMGDLRRKGFVERVMHPRRGYVLSKIPSRISIGTVIKNMEGSVSLMRCVDEVIICDGCKTNCRLRAIMSELNRLTVEFLESWNLQDLVELDSNIFLPQFHSNPIDNKDMTK